MRLIASVLLGATLLGDSLAAAQAPPPPTSEGDRSSRYRQAVALLRQGNDDEARSMLLAVVAAQPDFNDARLALGRLHLKAREYGDAEAQFRAVLDRAPGAARALLGLAEALGATGHVDQAIDLGTRALSNNPRPAAAHRALGRLYEMNGDKEKALAEYKAALRLLAEGRR